MPGGRPTKYSEEVLEQAREYIASCVDKVTKYQVGEDKDGNPTYGFKCEVRMPTAEGLASHLGVSRKTLYNWADKNEEFLHILEAINQEQVKRLIDKGLSGDYNSTIAKLVLARHGYKDESRVEDEGAKKQIDELRKDMREFITDAKTRPTNNTSEGEDGVS